MKFIFTEEGKAPSHPLLQPVSMIWLLDIWHLKNCILLLRHV